MNCVPMAIDDLDGEAAGGGKTTLDSEVDASAETAGGATVEDAKFDLDSLSGPPLRGARSLPSFRPER